MGNTLGAMVFLAAGAWLGWNVLNGRAQRFLSALAQNTGSGNAGGGTGTPPPANTQIPSGTVSGAGFNFSGDTLPSTTPTVFNDVFGHAGNSNGPNYTGPYGPYSPDYSRAYVYP